MVALAASRFAVAAGCGSSADATECFASSLQVFVGSTRTASAAVTQTGSTVNVTITDPDRGYSCVYTGTTGASAIQLTATTLVGTLTITSDFAVTKQ